MAKEKSEVDVKREKPESPATAETSAPLASLREEIDRLFDDFGTGLWRQPLSRRMRSLFPTAAEWASAPAMEIAECNGDDRITAELPGLTPDDVEVKLSDGMITIHGQKSEERREEKENYLLSERRYGSFRRDLPLPQGVDADNVTASVANAVLTAMLPKTVEAKKKERKIEVKAA